MCKCIQLDLDLASLSTRLLNQDPHVFYLFVHSTRLSQTKIILSHKVLEEPVFSQVDITSEDEEVETMQEKKCLRKYWVEKKRKQ